MITPVEIVENAHLEFVEGSRKEWKRQTITQVIRKGINNWFRNASNSMNRSKLDG
jgi:hypothetical protein